MSASSSCTNPVESPHPVARRGRLPLALILLAALASACGFDAGAVDLKQAEAGHAASSIRAPAGWRRHTGPVPILVYHALGNPPVGAPFPGLYVSLSAFAAEMRWLHDHGYTGVTLDQVEQAWYHKGLLPPKPIVITFDNGYPTQATMAPRVLSRYGWKGV